jgi:hypothetical protein
MRIKYLITLFAFFLCVNLYCQDTSWIPVKIDEDLTVSIPKEIQEIDTTLSMRNTRLGFRVLKAKTKECVLGATVTPHGTNLNVDSKESLESALNGIAKGASNQAKHNGFDYQYKDSLIDNLPCKKAEYFKPWMNEPVVYNYTFLVNDKIYMFTIAPLKFNGEKTKLIEESKRFLNSISFSKTIKERSFFTKAVPAKHTINYYLIPAIFGIACIAYVVIRLVKS